MKKVLSLILAVVMILSTAAICFATNEEDMQIVVMGGAPMLGVNAEDHNVMLTTLAAPALITLEKRGDEDIAAGPVVISEPTQKKAKFDPLDRTDALKAISDFGRKNKTKNATRGDVIALLWTISNTPYLDYWMTFEDMDYDGPNTEAYRWASAEKILQGYGSGLSGIDDPITLEQLATFLYRHTLLLGNDTSKVQENTNTLSYDGIFDVSDWAAEADHWALAAGVIVPPEGVHHPQEILTRKDVATILTRYIDCPKTVTNPVLKFSDNLPDIKLRGTYTALSAADYEGDDEMLWKFEGGEDAECDFVYGYRWKATKSLLSEAKADAKKYFPNQEIEFKEAKVSYEDGEADYVYYVAYEPTEKQYFLEWYYKDNGYIYQSEGAYNTTEVQIPGTESSFALPSCMEVTEVIAPKAVLQLKSNYPAFADCAVYVDAPDFDYLKENLEEEWGVSNLVISEKKYSSGKAGGYFITYTFIEDGQTYDAEVYVIKLDDCYINFEFRTLQGAEHADWAMDSNRAIVTSGH